MRLIRIITALVVGLAVAGAPAAAEAAQPYPPGPPSLTTNAPTVELGDEITLFGEGYYSDETVEITVTFQPAGSAPPLHFVVVTDGNGAFQFTYRASRLGEARHVAVGRSSGRRAEAIVNVVPDGALTNPGAGNPGGGGGGGAGDLPVTGDNLAAQIGVGVGLLGLGGVLVLLTARRRRRSGRGAAGWTSAQ